ncbi:hypothetical protein ALP33_102709 [Pseudomonas amygdali pv. lachrymans]|uniref:Uncharacterized protein n=2 Tax=Pseudomonas amygdali TaxID=47877 RepID=A0AAX1VZR0_PSEAJ|nr:hypothetical protein ALQ89_100894 [Pseudomonas amygdali pv. tabaci]RMM45992.1 hypothetical protein ALQ79_102704 [Pseudomonas amygdali pv. lachrymans]RMS35751.1 hypothetical protein ALP67_102643 [Pseudomonas ficuserectae]RMU13240.1 hypothetical protein ALP33_102709 [Pseudomonas amygdali pv. lachrymans]
MQPELTLLINSTSESFMGAILITGKKRGAKDNGNDLQSKWPRPAIIEFFDRH